MQRRDQLARILLAQRLGRDILVEQQLDPVEQLRRRGFFLYPRDLAHVVENTQGFGDEALRIFYDVREVPGIKKKPSTSELLDWIKLLLNEDVTAETLREQDPRKLIPPLHGALLKNEQDIHLFERLAFLTRRKGE